MGAPQRCAILVAGLTVCGVSNPAEHTASENNSAGDDRCLLTAHQVADILGMTPGWVYEQSRRGRIPTVVLGRYRRYRRGAIDEWIADAERGTRSGR